MAPRMLVNPTQASPHYFLQRKKFLVVGIVSKQMLNEMLKTQLVLLTFIRQMF